MVASISLNRIKISPGQRIYLPDVSWIEPDDCFYLKNCQAILGKKGLDLAIDPPPDLAIEIDLTSPTQLSAYESLGVPEIWRYQQGKLSIFILIDGHYLESSTSSLFPSLPVNAGFSQILERPEILMSEARKEFRQWVRQNLVIDK
jgi:Uma2 family endonuclease